MFLALDTLSLLAAIFIIIILYIFCVHFIGMLDKGPYIACRMFHANCKKNPRIKTGLSVLQNAQNYIAPPFGHLG